MGYAYKCDTCGKLYEGKHASMQIEDDPKVNVVYIVAKKGNVKLDICSNCVRAFCEKILDHDYSEDHK